MLNPLLDQVQLKAANIIGRSGFRRALEEGCEPLAAVCRLPAVELIEADWAATVQSFRALN